MVNCRQNGECVTGPSPLLNRLFLDHDIIFNFLTTLKKFKKDLS